MYVGVNRLSIIIIIFKIPCYIYTSFLLVTFNIQDLQKTHR